MAESHSLRQRFQGERHPAGKNLRFVWCMCIILICYMQPHLRLMTNVSGQQTQSECTTASALYMYTCVCDLFLSCSTRVLPLSHDEARKALLRFVNKRWFADKSPAIEFDFVNIQSSPAYRVRHICLASYTCTRTPLPPETQ